MKELAIKALSNIKGGLKTTLAGIVMFMFASFVLMHIIDKEVTDLEIIALVGSLYFASIVLFLAKK